MDKEEVMVQEKKDKQKIPLGILSNTLKELTLHRNTLRPIR
jgi:hypothetical protein